MSREELRAEAHDLRAAIFAYEMSGDADRIPYADNRLREDFRLLSSIENPTDGDAG
jgi:hypothetical protein